MSVLRNQTATDYLDALNQLETFLTNRSLVSVAIAGGGAGYVVGDVLTITGGTQTALSIPIELVVTTEAAGVITGVRITQSGSYTVDPSSPAGHTGGTGAGATFTLTMADVGWTRLRRTQEAVSAVVAFGGTGYVIGDDLDTVGGVDVPTAARWNVDSEGASSATVQAGGVGYTVGDQLTVSGGTFGAAAVFNVDTAPAGVVGLVSLVTRGTYTATPGNPAATTGGTGAGCTLNVTYGAVGAVSLLDKGKYGEPAANPSATAAVTGVGVGATLTVTYQDLTADNFDLILEGVGSGADEIFLGFRTFQISSARNWEMAGFSGYDAIQPYGNQPGVSPGRYDLAGVDGEGAYTPLDNSSLKYWFYANGRRLVAVFKVGAGTYTNLHVGWLNPAGTSSEFPYPLLIEGTTSNPGTLFSSTVIGYSGLCDPISANGQNTGPALYRDPQGVWNTLRNSNETGGGRNARDEFVIWPCGSPGTLGLATDDIVSPGTNITTDLIPNTGNPGVPTDVMKQTPETGDDVSLMWSTMIIREGNGANIARDVHGEMEGVFWTTADISGTAETAVSEDEFQNGGEWFDFFANGNRTELFSHVAIRVE